MFIDWIAVSVFGKTLAIAQSGFNSVCSVFRFVHRCLDITINTKKNQSLGQNIWF